MKTPAWCRVNLNTVFQALTLCGYSILFLLLLKTGLVKNYLHPRMIPYVAFAALAFLLMVFSLFRSFKKHERRFKLAPVILFALPLFLAFFVQPSPSSVSSLHFSNNKIVGISARHTVSGKRSTILSSGSQQKLRPNQKAVKTTSAFGAPVTLIITDNTISMDDANIISWVNELNSHPDHYAGFKIDYTGSVYKSGDGLHSNQFVPGRNMMWCCAADIQMIGILCQYDQTPELRENNWVHVTGTLATSTYQGAKVPMIVNPTVEPAPAPQADYVYPY